MATLPPDGLYDSFYIRYFFEGKEMTKNYSSSMGVQKSGDPVGATVTSDWLVSGPNGEAALWYWDSSYQNGIQVGSTLSSQAHVFLDDGISFGIIIYGKRMDIKLKMGAKTDLPSAKNKGTVYFAKDGDKNFGELYYDDENGNRVKVGGTNISQTHWSNADDTWRFYINMEDGTTIVSNNSIPDAGFTNAGYPITGLLTHQDQAVLGLKTFQSITIGSPESIFSLEKQALLFTDAGLANKEHSMPIICGTDDFLIAALSGQTVNSLITNFSENINTLSDLVDELETGLGVTATVGAPMGIMADRSILIAAGESLSMFTASGFITDQLGFETSYIPTAYIEELHASSIHSTMFTGAFTGDLEGTAKDAISWANSITLNDTLVKGGETAAITTNKWGAARTISISGTAGTTGTSIDGSNTDGYTLIIPATMTGFTSITSTDLLATNLGAASTPIAVSHFKETYFHNPNNNNYKHKLTSNAGSASCELQLPNTSGLLVSKPNATASVGDINSPVYVAMNGEVTACTTIAVDHGGTGSNSLATGAILVGNGTSAVATVAGTTAGRILVANGTSKAPIYASPTLSFSTGTGNPTLSLTINGSTYTTATGIQAATGENPGIVSTVAQTFGGAKTFSGAATFSAGITSTTGTFSGQINATSIKLSGQLKSHSAGTSYITLTDTRATMTSPTVHLNGTTIVLNSSNYGATLPTTDLEEGRIFFLLT